LLFAVLLFAYLFSQFFRSFMAVVAGDLARDLALGPAALGALSSAWFFSFAAAQFLVGYLLDTAGPRRTMGGLLFAAVAGAMLFAVSPGFEVSFAAMVLIGVGCAPLLMGSLYLFGRLWPAERFAVLAGSLVGLGNLGNIVAATPLAFAAATLGWRLSMALVGAFAAIAALALLLLVRDPPSAPRGDGGKASVWGDLAAILRIRALWLAFPLHLAGYAMIASERGLWAGPYLATVHQLSEIATGHVLLAMSLGMAAGALACGQADRLAGGPKWPALAASLVTALLFLLLATGLSGNIAVAAALLTGIGFFGLSYSLMLGHGRAFFPDHLLGRGVTTLNFLAIGGAGLVQAITGSAMEAMQRAGLTASDSYALMHAGMGLLLLASALLFSRVPARPPDPPPMPR
jgi:sugar phosphate permease